MQSNTDQVLQTLRLIAKGIIRFQQQCADPELLSPGELEHGLNMLNVLRYQRSLPLIRSVPALLAWCRKPLPEWPLDVAELGIPPELSDQPLLEGTEPTRLCQCLAQTQ